MLAFRYKIILCMGLISVQAEPNGEGDNKIEKKDAGGAFSWSIPKIPSFADIGGGFISDKFENVIITSMDSLPEGMRPMRPTILTVLKHILSVGFPLGSTVVVPIVDRVIAKYSSPQDIAKIEEQTQKAQKSLDTTDVLLYKMMAENIDDENKLKELMDLGSSSETVKKATNSFLISLNKIVNAHVKNYVTKMEDTTEAILKQLSEKNSSQ